MVAKVAEFTAEHKSDNFIAAKYFSARYKGIGFRWFNHTIKSCDSGRELQFLFWIYYSVLPD
jgi:hypothetical protein